jgi:PAS domain S-box-containing protein
MQAGQIRKAVWVLAQESVTISLLRFAARMSDSFDRILERLSPEDRETVERKLESVERLEIIIRAMDEAHAIVLADFEGRITYANQASLDMWGLNSGKEVLGTPIDEMWQDDAQADKLIDTLSAGEGRYEGEASFTAKDGTTTDVLVSANMVADEEGRPQVLIASFIDITEQKESQASLRRSEERFKALFEQAGDYLLVIDLETMNLVNVNKSAYEIHGYSSAKEMLGMNIFDIDSMEWTEDQKSGLMDVLHSGVPLIFETEHKKKDGSTFPIEVSAKVIESGGSRLIYSMERDISERKRREGELRSLQRQLLEKDELLRYEAGRDLHEDKAQTIAALTMQLSSLMKELRISAETLSPGSMDILGLAGSLESFAAHVAGRSGIQCEFNKVGNPPLLDRGTAMHVFRIVQDIVNHAVGHKKSGRLVVRLVTEDQDVCVSVEDDGAGLAEPREEGIELRFARYRAELINATIDVQSTKEGSSIVTCKYPIPKANDG